MKNTATLPLKASSKRNNVLLFIFCGQTDFAQMPFILRYVHYMVIRWDAC